MMQSHQAALLAFGPSSKASVQKQVKVRLLPVTEPGRLATVGPSIPGRKLPNFTTTVEEVRIPGEKPNGIGSRLIFLQPSVRDVWSTHPIFRSKGSTGISGGVTRQGGGGCRRPRSIRLPNAPAVTAQALGCRRYADPWPQCHATSATQPVR